MENDNKKYPEIEEETFNEGPLSLLKDAVKTNSQILVYCRNNRKLLGRIRAFDRHMNIILEAVCEIWSEMIKGKNKQHKLRNRERFISKLFLRGDSIILIVKNPNEAKPETPNKKIIKNKKKKNDEEKENEKIEEKKEEKEDEKENEKEEEKEEEKKEKSINLNEDDDEEKNEVQKENENEENEEISNPDEVIDISSKFKRRKEK